MRKTLLLVVVSTLGVASVAVGQTQTQAAFTCTRTAHFVGDGFTLNCDVADNGTTGDGGTTDGGDFTIRNVRRYKSSIDEAHWLYFDVVAGIDYDRFTLTVNLHYSDGTFRSCTDRVPAMTSGQVDEGLVIPDICGPDVEWSAAEFIPPSHLTCSGCGVYQFDDLPIGRAIPPGASDSGLELERVLEDYRLQAQHQR